MRVRFRDVPICEWSIATTRAQNAYDLGPFQVYGYGVDVGMGSFADSAGLVSVLQEYKEQGKYLYDEFYFERVLPAYEANNGLSADILLDPATGANLVVCSAGHGDGFYASYWGMSLDGEPVCLVTDFGLLTHHVQATREVGQLADLVRRQAQIELPGGSVVLRAQMPDSRTLVVEVSGQGAATAEFELRQGGELARPTGGTISYGEQVRTIRTQFKEPIADHALLVVTFLDRIEPL